MKVEQNYLFLMIVSCCCSAVTGSCHHELCGEIPPSGPEQPQTSPRLINIHHQCCSLQTWNRLSGTVTVSPHTAVYIVSSPDPALNEGMGLIYIERFWGTQDVACHVIVMTMHHLGMAMHQLLSHTTTVGYIVGCHIVSHRAWIWLACQNSETSPRKCLMYTRPFSLFGVGSGDKTTMYTRCLYSCKSVYIAAVHDIQHNAVSCTLSIGIIYHVYANKTQDLIIHIQGFS